MAIQERLLNALSITFPYRAPLRIDHFAVMTTTRCWMNVTRSLEANANLRVADELRAFLEKPILEAGRLIADHTGIRRTKS